MTKDPAKRLVCAHDFGMDDLACGCIFVDETRHITFANNYITEEFGWDQDWAKGKSIEMLLSPASLMFCESYVYPILSQKGRCDEVQLSFVSPRGGRIPAIVNLRLVGDGAVAWSIFGATNRDKLYQELVDARNQLEQQAIQLERLSKVDDLTGLMNRRALNEYAEKEFAEADRTGNPITVLLLDIDNFKAINDTHGHNFGDDVLRKAGATFSATCRSSELAARIGGEEFLFLLNANTCADALAFADRVHADINEAFKLFYPITVSIGVAARIGNEGDSFLELLGQADKALYAAKASGKNKTVTAETFPNLDCSKAA